MSRTFEIRFDRCDDVVRPRQKSYSKLKLTRVYEYAMNSPACVIPKRKQSHFENKRFRNKRHRPTPLKLLSTLHCAKLEVKKSQSNQPSALRRIPVNRWRVEYHRYRGRQVFWGCKRKECFARIFPKTVYTTNFLCKIFCSCWYITIFSTMLPYLVLTSLKNSRLGCARTLSAATWLSNPMHLPHSAREANGDSAKCFYSGRLEGHAWTLNNQEV